MNDGALLAFGCGVLFLAIAGAYVAIRGRFWAHEEHGRSVAPAQRVAPLRPRP